ncbi:hypothetical protein D3C77_802640 [compost metagenome]
MLSPLVSHTPARAESSVMGTIIRIASGRLRLSYIAANTRNTSRTLMGNTQSAELPVSTC